MGPLDTVNALIAMHISHVHVAGMEVCSDQSFPTLGRFVQLIGDVCAYDQRVA